MAVDFYRHNIGAEEIARVTAVLQSRFLTTGEEVAEFERRLAAFTGLPHAVGVTSCTAALHLALLALHVGPGDEVITTPMSFVATANAVLHTGARPVFVDVEPGTGNLDAGLVERAVTPRTRAILPVHLYGQMCDMRAIRALADRHSLVVVEDAAHSLESRRDDVGPGHLSDAACFSFYATKSITSGEGGAVAMRRGDAADTIRRLRLHGMDLDAADRYAKRYRHYDVDLCGWKYNMDNIQAALLLPQLERASEYRQRREEICRRYEAALKGAAGVELMSSVPNSVSGRHLFTILVDPAQRDDIIWALQDRGIGVAVNYRPIHLLAFYRRTYGYGEGAYPVAEDIGRRTISLPLYPKLTDAEADEVIGAVLDVVVQ